MARLVLALCLLLSIACGPSLKQAQRSTARYEQCYGADYDPSVTLERRQSCWSAWLHDRIETDPPERVRYAEMRLEQLSAGEPTRPIPDPEAEPRPTYEHKYPRSRPAAYPTSACTPLCGDHWADCNAHCKMKDKDCTVACEAAFRICIGGCP
jgi:hypothetical protein